MTPSTKYGVSIIARNTGDAQWSKDDHVLLAIAGNDSYDTALFNNSTFMMEPNTIVRNGTNYTWKFTITAPQWVGNYTLAYQMKNDTGYWFGDTLIKNVTVGDPNSSAAFVSQSVKYYPAISDMTMKRNAKQNASISVKNLGRYNWSASDNVMPAAVDYEPNDVTRLGLPSLLHIAPDDVIRPGEIATWNVKIQAPQYPGTYHVKYRMQKGGQWFGNTLNVTVTVA